MLLPNRETVLSGRVWPPVLAVVVLVVLGLIVGLAMISDFEGIADVLSLLEGPDGT